MLLHMFKTLNDYYKLIEGPPLGFETLLEGMQTKFNNNNNKTTTTTNHNSCHNNNNNNNRMVWRNSEETP